MRTEQSDTETPLYAALLSELFDQHCQRLFAEFSKLDTEKTGRLSVQNVTTLLQSVCEEPSPQELDQMVASFTLDEEGMIEWSEIASHPTMSASPGAGSVPTDSDIAAAAAAAAAAASTEPELPLLSSSLRTAFDGLHPDERDRIGGTALKELIRERCMPSQQAVRQALELAEVGDGDLMTLEEYLRLALRLREKASTRRSRMSGGASFRQVQDRVQDQDATLEGLAQKEMDEIKAEFERLLAKRSGKEGQKGSSSNHEGVVGKVLADLGVSNGISLDMYQRMLCEIKYEVLEKRHSQLGSESHSLTPQRVNSGLSTPRRSGGPSSPQGASTGRSDQAAGGFQDSLRQQILKNAAMIAAEEGHTEGWKQVKQEKGITMWTRAIEGSASVGVKVASTMPLTAEQIYEVLVDPTTELSGSNDGDKLVEDLGGGCSVRWSRFKIPLCDASDFVNGEYTGESEGGLTYAFCGVEHPDCPPKPKHVRGTVLLGGWRMSPIESGEEKGRTRVTCISVCDLNRPIPKILAELGTKTSFKSMKALRTLLQKRYKKK